jgi:hypothetical protein
MVQEATQEAGGQTRVVAINGVDQREPVPGHERFPHSYSLLGPRSRLLGYAAMRRSAIVFPQPAAPYRRGVIQEGPLAVS